MKLDVDQAIERSEDRPACRSSADLHDARAQYERGLDADPENPNALHRLGMLEMRSGHTDRALDLLAKSIALAPDSPEFHNNYATVLGSLNRFDESLKLLDRAIELRPDYPEAHSNRGVTLEHLGRYEEALAAHRRALDLRPDYPQGLNNLGVTLRKLSRFDESAAAFRQAIALRPDYPEALNNLGIALQETGLLTDAIAAFEKAVAADSHAAPNHWNLSLALLLSGDFPRGWLEYEWRRFMPFDELAKRKIPGLEWNGSPITGRTILVIAEQGIGDTLHFIRFCSLLSQRGATVILECPARLISLLRGVDGIDQIIPRGQPLPRFDMHVRLMSIPGILGINLDQIPADIPYLRPDPDRVRHWREKLQALPGLKVGIAWQGNPKYPSDRDRSIPLASFAPLADIPGVRLISLQKYDGADQLQSWPGAAPIIDLAPALDLSDTFVDTAAVMATLDLVITSDTSIAHLAGALGVNVWVALPFAPEWRWLLARDDSPWYPTLRLFRQPRRGDWTAVFEQIAAALAALAGQRLPTSLTIPISPGEALDKLTILQIKAQQISDPAKLRHIRSETRALESAIARSIIPSPELDELVDELRSCNQALWEVEDQLRALEIAQDFGPEFISLARAVYHANDRRAAVKRSINELLNSPWLEEKHHPDYAPALSPDAALAS